jgi:alkylated DNA nucleotide flippase Atl1
MNKKKKTSWWVIDESDGGLQKECANKKAALREAAQLRKQYRIELKEKSKYLKTDIYIECQKD